MDKNREELRQWLRRIIAELPDDDATATGLARRAQMAASTITRFMKDDKSPMLSMRTITKISQAAGTSVQEMPTNGHRPTEAEQFKIPDDGPTTPIEKAVSELIDGRSSVDAWRLKSHHLALAGYLPGDILIVEHKVMPASGQPACVQVHAWEAQRSETLFRIYHHPYVVGASTNPDDLKPLLIDDDRVVITGRVAGSLRWTEEE